MKRIILKLLPVLVLLIAISGCQSKAEKIRNAKIKHKLEMLVYGRVDPRKIHLDYVHDVQKYNGIFSSVVGEHDVIPSLATIYYMWRMNEGAVFFCKYAIKDSRESLHPIALYCKIFALNGEKEALIKELEVEKSLPFDKSVYMLVVDGRYQAAVEKGVPEIERAYNSSGRFDGIGAAEFISRLADRCRKRVSIDLDRQLFDRAFRTFLFDQTFGDFLGKFRKGTESLDQAERMQVLESLMANAAIYNNNIGELKNAKEWRSRLEKIRDILKARKDSDIDFVNFLLELINRNERKV